MISSGRTSSQPSSSNRKFSGSSWSAATYVPINSWPAWPCHDDGGSSAESREASTARAAVPAPPATAALTNSYSGYRSSKTSIMASRPSASPPAVHQENTSTWLDSSPAADPAPPSSAQAAAASNARAVGTASSLLSLMTTPLLPAAGTPIRLGGYLVHIAGVHQPWR